MTDIAVVGRIRREGLLAVVLSFDGDAIDKLEEVVILSLEGCAAPFCTRAGSVVAGSKLVPVEPTEKMIIAGLTAGVEFDKPFVENCGAEAKAALLVKSGSHYSAAYRAMLAAAPAMALPGRDNPT